MQEIQAKIRSTKRKNAKRLLKLRLKKYFMVYFKVECPDLRDSQVCHQALTLNTISYYTDTQSKPNKTLSI